MDLELRSRGLEQTIAEHSSSECAPRLHGIQGLQILRSMNITPPSETYAVEVAAPHHAARAARLIDSVFAMPLDHKALFLEWLEDANRRVIVGSHRDTVVAIGVCTLRPVSRAEDYHDFSMDVMQWLEPHPQHIAIMNMMAVSPAHRRQGLARRVGQALMVWIRDRDCPVVLGVSWEHGGGHHSGHLFARAGFQRLGTSPTFYARVMPELDCPACAHKPCRCPASLFGLRLD